MNQMSRFEVHTPIYTHTWPLLETRNADKNQTLKSCPKGHPEFQIAKSFIKAESRTLLDIE